MNNISLPFSLSDILERIIPGSILICSLSFSVDPSASLFPYNAATVVMVAVFLVLSYAVGVSLNALAGFVHIFEYRRYWSESPSNQELEIKNAFQAHFGIEPNDSSWRLCYGTCIKNGYGSNTQVFLGLDVFCRAMIATCIITILALSSAIAYGWYFCSSFEEKHIYGIVSTVSLAPLMYRGAQIYSMAFVASIFKGFFNWYIDEKHSNHRSTRKPA